MNEIGRNAPPPSANRRIDHAQSALVNRSATANISIPIPRDDQKSQLTSKLIQNRSGDPRVSTAVNTPMTTSTAMSAFTAPETESRTRKGILDGTGESWAMISESEYLFERAQGPTGASGLSAASPSGVAAV